MVVDFHLYLFHSHMLWLVVLWWINEGSPVYISQIMSLWSALLSGTMSYKFRVLSPWTQHYVLHSRSLYTSTWVPQNCAAPALTISWVNCKAYLICFLCLRDQWSSSPDAYCHNPPPFFSSYILSDSAYFEWEGRSNPSYFWTRNNGLCDSTFMKYMDDKTNPFTRN